MVYLSFKTADGITLKMPVQEVAKKLGIKLDSFGTVGLICRKGEDDLIVTAEDGDDTYPGITLEQNISGVTGRISITELPNEDNDQVVTFLYAGNDETETDDWTACIADGVRDNGDNSRRMMYLDWDLVEAESTKAMPQPIPYTEEQHNLAIREVYPKVHTTNPADYFSDGKPSTH